MVVLSHLIRHELCGHEGDSHDPVTEDLPRQVLQLGWLSPWGSGGMHGCDVDYDDHDLMYILLVARVYKLLMACSIMRW
jgi:hypothetical protein